MIDAVDVGLGENGLQARVQLAGAGAVVAEGFFDDDATPGAGFGGVLEAGRADAFGDTRVVAGLR